MESTNPVMGIVVGNASLRRARERKIDELNAAGCTAEAMYTLLAARWQIPADEVRRQYGQYIQELGL